MSKQPKAPANPPAAPSTSSPSQPVAPAQPQIQAPTPQQFQPGPSAQAKTAPKPPAQPAPGSPSGPMTVAQVCCPDVATFEGSTGARSTYFGFDDKTNVVAATSKPYWDPPTNPKKIGGKEDRDGARWVSVGVGLKARVEINFGGTFTNACLLNCKFEVDPTAVAKVVSPQPTATGVSFEIEGQQAGEASLKVMCDGKLRGYFHIWCVQPTSMPIDFVSVVTAKSVGSTISLAALKTELVETLGQAVMTFDILDCGVVDLSGDAAFTKIEAKFYNAAGEFDSSEPAMRAIEKAAVAGVKARGTGNQLRSNSLKLYYYVPPVVADDIVGSVISLGQSPAFTFTNDPIMTYNTTAHELGHSLDLVHPNDTHTNGGSSQTNQFPAHHLPTLQVQTTAMPKTNTEPSVPAGEGGLDANGYDKNIMAADPLNLMGYWIDFQEAKPIRYRQWKHCRRQP